MINKLDTALGHLESLECCMQIIVDALPANLDRDSIDSMVNDYIIVALKELDMAKYLINVEQEEQ